MHNIAFLRKVMILVFATISFSSQSLIAQEGNDLSYLGASYSSGGAVGLNIFYTDEGLYTSITAAIPAETLQDNGTMSGSDFSMDELIGQHIGVVFYDLEPLAVGLGFVWGGSYYKDQITNGRSENVAYVRVGFEVPISYTPIKEIPIMILPFYEIMVNTDDDKNWDNSRMGVNVLAHIQFLEPLTFQVEYGISNSSVNNLGNKIIESGVGNNWRIGVGFDFDFVGDLL